MRYSFSFFHIRMPPFSISVTLSFPLSVYVIAFYYTEAKKELKKSVKRLEHVFYSILWQFFSNIIAVVPLDLILLLWACFGSFTA